MWEVCDTCKYMKKETSYVDLIYFNKRLAIHGKLVHLKPTVKPKLRWFVYLMENTGCRLQYFGSTTDICGRGAVAKSTFNKANSNSTGLYKHFQEGCPRMMDMRRSSELN